MNIFSPGSMKISRGQNISDWTYIAGDFEFPRVETPDDPDTPEQLQLYPGGDALPRTPQFFQGGSNPEYLTRQCLPGALHKDVPSANLKQRDATKINNVEVINDEGTISYIGKFHHRLTSYYWRRGNFPSDGFYDASFYRFSGIIYHLPEYFILDATTSGSYSFSTGGQTFVTSAGEVNISKFLMRRDDRLGFQAIYDQAWDSAYQMSATTPTLYRYSGLSELGYPSYTATAPLPLMASYVPIYDITRKMSNDQLFEEFEQRPSWVLSCRPWGRFWSFQGGGTPDGLHFAPIEWHLFVPDPESDLSDTTNWPKIYVPESAFYWRCTSGSVGTPVATKDYRKWYAGKNTRGGSQVGPVSTTNANQCESLWGLEDEDNLDSKEHHGYLNPYGTTKFMLGSIGEYTQDNAPYASGNALNLAGRILVTPCYL